MMDIFHQICRSCNNERKNMLNIFESKLLAKSVHIEEMLSSCFQESVAIDDKYPKQICYLCAKQLEITYKYLLQYKKSKQQFDQILEYIEKCEPEDDQDEGRNESDKLGLKYECADEYENQQQQLLTDNSNTSDQVVSGTPLKSCLENQNNLNSADDIWEVALENTPRHKENETNEIETRIPCSYCAKSFLTAKALILHQKISHKLKFKSESKQNLSSKCGTTLESNSLLGEHTKLCSAKNRIYNCAICSKEFISKVKLQQHKQICFE